MRPAERVRALPPYPLAGIPELRRELEEEGVDVIDLGAGDADLPPPPAAVDALARAGGDPALSRYPFQLGLPGYREAVAAFMHERFGVTVDPYHELLPLLGSKEGIAHMALAVLEAGDVAVMPDPGYQAYLGGTLLAGGEPRRVPLRPENDFLVPLAGLAREVEGRLRLLYLNYPNNPTAATADASYLAEAVELCRREGAVLVHDAAYSEIAYEGYRPPSVLEVPGAREVSVEFHSMSKTFNMTGWRLGWAAGGEALIAALSKVKSFVDTGVFLAVQRAGQAALESRAEWLPENVRTFRRRRDAAVRVLDGAGFDVRAPRATLYLWIPVPGGEGSHDFARRALEETGVVVLPGAALGEGGEGFFRIALTVPEERITEAAARLGDVVG